MAISTH